MEQGSVSLPDLLRTLVEFTVSSIVLAYRRFILPRAEVEEIVLSGGGARNPVMVQSLREKLSPIGLSLSDEYGISAEAKEAAGFAVLANETVCANRANIPEVTGARGGHGSRKNLDREERGIEMYENPAVFFIRRSPRIPPRGPVHYA